jgi:hypothetical protein
MGMYLCADQQLSLRACIVVCMVQELSMPVRMHMGARIPACDGGATPHRLVLGGRSTLPAHRAGGGLALHQEELAVQGWLQQRQKLAAGGAGWKGLLHCSICMKGSGGIVKGCSEELALETEGAANETGGWRLGWVLGAVGHGQVGHSVSQSAFLGRRRLTHRLHQSWGGCPRRVTSPPGPEEGEVTGETSSGQVTKDCTTARKSKGIRWLMCYRWSYKEFKS